MIGVYCANGQVALYVSLSLRTIYTVYIQFHDIRFTFNICMRRIDENYCRIINLRVYATHLFIWPKCTFRRVETKRYTNVICWMPIVHHHRYMYRVLIGVSGNNASGRTLCVSLILLMKILQFYFISYFKNLILCTQQFYF